MSKTHTLKEGETLPRIAAQAGFHSWIRVFNHPHNAALRAKRSSPHLVAVGDEIFIPDIEPKFEATPTGSRTVSFVLHREEYTLELNLQGDDAAPLRGWAYVLRVGPVVESGIVDGASISHAVPLDQTQGTITLTNPDTGFEHEYELSLGPLEPVQTDRGVQARLQNLGFFEGELDGDLTTGAAVSAILRFREAHDLAGEEDPVDPPFRTRLKDVHGC